MSGLEDLIDDQGELALIIEANELGDPVIVGYMSPNKKRFENKEDLRNAYLTASLQSKAVYSIHEVESKKNLDHPVELLSTFFYNTELDEKDRPQEIKVKNYTKERTESVDAKDIRSTFGKYKPVALKARPQYTELPSEFVIKREIKGDPLANMPELSVHPPDFEPTGRFTAERKAKLDEVHDPEFLWPEKKKLRDHFMSVQNKAFAWDDSERGHFKEEFFPPVKMPVVPHTPWVERNIPIPPGIFNEVCKAIKVKIDAGVYEPSNSSYRSKWFCVVKKDGKSLRLVHGLEQLNKVTVAHSGVPPATEEIAESFAGKGCGSVFDLYVGYDERLLDEASRDYTTFQTPYGALRLTTLPMGWTNSVPIFHDDVTYILADEIPHVTRPYIDDVPVAGPPNRFEEGISENGEIIYKLHPENSGIRWFVWIHFQDLNRVVQRIKYAGGTFSGKKAYICEPEIMVVGHHCTYEG